MQSFAHFIGQYNTQDEGKECQEGFNSEVGLVAPVVLGWLGWGDREDVVNILQGTVV
jgi:hypothetical protein